MNRMGGYRMIRIALLHLNLAGGPRERNLPLLLGAAERAAAAGADWIVTPETALEGYFFYARRGRYEEGDGLSAYMAPFAALARERHVTLFLSAVEKEGDALYNSCFVITPSGIGGRHRKIHSHQHGAEAWVTEGKDCSLMDTRPVRAGLLVCADAYYEDTCQALRAQSPPVVLVSVAWPPGSCCPNPTAIWERCSDRCGAPVIVCNQTGYFPEMDMSSGKSALIEKGHCRFFYEGEPAILLFRFDERRKQSADKAFQIIPADDALSGHFLSSAEPVK